MNSLTTEWRFCLGEKVRDGITGFTGIVTARVEYFNGCRQYCVQPEVSKDGNHRDSLYIDEGQLSKTTGNEQEAEPKDPGGVMPNEPPK